MGDQVGAQDGPLMPGESGTRSPKSSPVLLPIADPTAWTRMDTCSGAAKAGMLRRGCTDSPAEPVTGLSLQVTGFALKPQVALSVNHLEVC